MITIIIFFVESGIYYLFENSYFFTTLIWIYAIFILCLPIFDFTKVWIVAIPLFVIKIASIIYYFIIIFLNSLFFLRFLVVLFWKISKLIVN